MPMDCMDNINWGNCLWFEGGGDKRNVVSGMISGLLVCATKVLLLLKNDVIMYIVIVCNWMVANN